MSSILKAREDANHESGARRQTNGEDRSKRLACSSLIRAARTCKRDAYAPVERPVGALQTARALLLSRSFLLFLMPKCPTCGKMTPWQDNPWRPFCSERCKLIDFDKWTSEEYRVPGQQINPAELPAEPTAPETGNLDETHRQ